MPASPKAFAALAERLSNTPDAVTRDMLLDRWLDYRDRATEWDAARWGFDPDRWCEHERAELVRRGRFETGFVHLDDTP
ncbi:hypothetical protein [Streptomyces alboflavus]|uniref:hypothetical protein n=1 Tax=Streptomyces alboflavus TaxID=67267 RepID=UPI000F657095|nr:hypothetical protein [Streptomyces alboflavus]